VLRGIQQQHWPLIQQVTMEVRQQHIQLVSELCTASWCTWVCPA
jgi:transposase